MTEEIKRVDWDDVKIKLESTVTEALDKLLVGAADDLATYIERITRMMVSAGRSGDAALIAELKHQVKLLAEIHRIRAVNAQWAVVGDVVGSMASVLSTAIRAGVLKV